MINVRSQIDDLTQGLTELQKATVPRAAQMALNRVAPTVRTATVRELQASLKLRNQKGLRGIIKVVKAQKGNLTAEVKTDDLGISLDETRNALVRVSRKRIKLSNGRMSKHPRKVTTVLFKGKKVDGLIQIELASVKTIRKKEDGRYSGGKRSQKVAPVFAYRAVQELIYAKIDQTQERLGMERFPIEFARALEHGIRAARFKG